MKMCAVHVGLCDLERDVVGGSREVLGKWEYIEGGVRLGWVCGCAEFPRRVPRAGGRRRRRGAFQLGVKLVTQAPTPMKY